MPEIVETTVYRLAELSDAAKDNACGWYREGGFDYDWYDAIVRGFPAHRGNPRYPPQDPHRWPHGRRITTGCLHLVPGLLVAGDGACWEGFYTYRKAASAEIRSYAPQDTTLHRIADALSAVQKRNFYQLRAEASHRGHYYHEYCMSIAVERDSPTSQDMTADAEDVVIEALRDLARWLYRQLEREYEYLSSDEAVDETIIANEYTFTDAGRRFG